MMESMWFLPDPWFAASVAFDVALVPGAPSAALTQRRQRRLEALLDAARGSAFYRERFARHGSRLEQQPPVTKEALMLRLTNSKVYAVSRMFSTDTNASSTSPVNKYSLMMGAMADL